MKSTPERQSVNISLNWFLKLTPERQSVNLVPNLFLKSTPVRQSLSIILNWFMKLTPVRQSVNLVLNWFMNSTTVRQFVSFVPKWFVKSAPERHRRAKPGGQVQGLLQDSPTLRLGAKSNVRQDGLQTGQCEPILTFKKIISPISGKHFGHFDAEILLKYFRGNLQYFLNKCQYIRAIFEVLLSKFLPH
jgi:hypothetical protein